MQPLRYLLPLAVLLFVLYAASQTAVQQPPPAAARLLGAPPRSTATLVLRTRLLGGASSPQQQQQQPAAPPPQAPAAQQQQQKPPLPAAPAPLPPPPPPAAAAAAAAAPSLHAPALAAPQPLRPVRELLPLVHPLYPYPSTQAFSVALATPWFGGDMPYFAGAHTCPASGCRVTLARAGAAGAPSLAEADVALYHLRPGDFAGGEGVAPPSRGGRQLVALMLAEGFDAVERPPELYQRFNAEHSFRPHSLVRDSYILWFLNDAHKQGIAAPQRPLTLEARAWGDVWEPPLPLAARSRAHLASWGSHYCSGARSGREDLVRALLAGGLRVAVYGAEGNCLRNVGAEALAADRGAQFAAMRTHKFYLAFENHRLEGYVSEKFYWALLRGQVPVVWGAPDIARYAPGPGSYIDASAFPSPAALVAHLQALDADDAAYASYHAWRTELSFADYGDVLREELVEMLWVGSASMAPVDWYNCRMCHALERHRARGGFDSAPPMGVPTMRSSEAPAFAAQ